MISSPSSIQEVAHISISPVPLIVIQILETFPHQSSSSRIDGRLRALFLRMTDKPSFHSQ